MADLPIGVAIRTARESRGRTQRELADKVGSSRTWVSKLESGKNAPMLDSLMLLGDALDIPAWKILRYAQRLQAKAEKAGGAEAGA